MGGSYCGRKGMPREWIDQMYSDYQSGLSLSEVGDKYGRTRQSIHDIFKRRGLKLRSRNFKKQITYRGRKYTMSKGDYYRDTIFRSGKYSEETFLHRRIWTDLHGPIPPGYTVCFRDGNRHNFKPCNLILLSHDEQQQLRGSRGQNQHTKVAPARLKALLHTLRSRKLVASLLISTQQVTNLRRNK